MPTQTVFSASWGSWYSFFIHTYIYMYLFHTKMAHAHPNRFLCLVGFLVFYFHPYLYIYMYLFHTKMAHAHPNRFLCLVGCLVFYFYPYIYMCVCLFHTKMVAQALPNRFLCLVGFFIHIYICICICSTLRWHMPTQTVFSASWGSWHSIIHTYIYIRRPGQRKGERVRAERLWTRTICLGVPSPLHWTWFQNIRGNIFWLVF